MTESDISEEKRIVDCFNMAINGHDLNNALRYLYSWGDGEGGWILEQIKIAVGGGCKETGIEKHSKKEHISHELRRRVFERDKYRCKHCDTHLDLSVDHIHPESKGGTLDMENLQTLCRSCNSQKGVNLHD